MTNLMHKFLFYNKFIIFLYMFRALLCSSSGGQIILYNMTVHFSIVLANDQLNAQILVL